MRKNQLLLIDTKATEGAARGDDFRLDDRTRELGRHGVAAAREALRRAMEKAA